MPSNFNFLVKESEIALVFLHVATPPPQKKTVHLKSLISL